MQDPAIALARRLRDLREHRWPGHTITQAQLAEALRDAGKLSVPLLSSWENLVNPKQPPQERLAVYARFFATDRSIERKPYRLLPLSELTADELARHDRLLAELTALRTAARGGPPAIPQPTGEDLLSFPPDENIVIVCAPLPELLRKKLPFVDLLDPDYVDLYKYTDQDALLEVYGHIRAMNPTNRVSYKLSSELSKDNYTSHLILLGGVDWNEVASALFDRVELPVRQTTRDEDDDIGYFMAEGVEYHPLFSQNGGRRILTQDVAHFYRGTSPFNKKRTVVSFNGMYGRGTLGAVRALTDVKFRERNEAYVRENVSRYAGWSLLMRVEVVNGQVVTPDWTVPETRLHEWVELDRGQESE